MVLEDSRDDDENIEDLALWRLGLWVQSPWDGSPFLVVEEEALLSDEAGDELDMLGSRNKWWHLIRHLPLWLLRLQMR